MRRGIDKAVALSVVVCVCGIGPGCGDSDRKGEVSQSESASHRHSPSNAGSGTAPPVLSVGESGRSDAQTIGERRFERVHNALMPLQVLIGQWRGVTRKTIGGAASLEEPVWTWDLLSEPDQPALLMTSATSPYLRRARLTWRATDAAKSHNAELELTVLDRFGTECVYRGTFARPVEDLPDPNGRPQKTYRLEFDRDSPAETTRFSRIVLIQENTDRYLLEVYDEQDGQIIRYDTVVNERQGPSFAVEEEGSMSEPCIMLHGRGTIPVNHDGQTYWVCCPGCQRAFEDDSDRWIARFRKAMSAER